MREEPKDPQGDRVGPERVDRDHQAARVPPDIPLAEQRGGGDQDTCGAAGRAVGGQ